MTLTRQESNYSIPAQNDKQRRSFVIPKKDRSYAKQYANLYWLRLAVLRSRVTDRAKHLWSNMPGMKEPPQHVKRVLDVENGQLCFIVGTVYMDMPLKPNVIEDLARENFIAAPPARRKICSDSDEMMLEDESGRIRLVGDRVLKGGGAFVTGTIMAALGAETASGDFEVFEVCYAGVPAQPPLKPTTEEGEWVALISGLNMGGSDVAEDVRTSLLSEWLVGELGDDEDAQEASKVTRVIIAGNALAAPVIDVEAAKRRYGYDASTYSAKPTATLDNFLSDILPSVSVDLMPGETDPVGPFLPQQPLHPAMLPKTAAAGGIEYRTNPFWFEVGGASFFGNSGQPLDDIFKYLDSEDRLAIAQQTLEWAHMAPTCPDTLWCYPFTDQDPFILTQSPHVYFIGNQPAFETTMVPGYKDDQAVRVVLIPKFCDTGDIVLVNTSSLECKVVHFGVE
ncbi:hypothetical protein T439DRAFT_378985 [Meredithblackwellia eburnea MCA 4105]